MASAGVAKTGTWVEVRPLEEILATLDENGALQALPFMPEMAQYAGRRFPILKSAHKTCDPTGVTDLRRLPDAVHLPTRCHGGAHGDCEANCLLFWKQDWLKRVDGPGKEDAPVSNPAPDLTLLQAATQANNNAGEKRYRCQATQIVAATSVLPVSNLRQYFDDIASGNVPPVNFILEMFTAYGKSAIGKIGKIFGLKLGAETFTGGARANAVLEKLNLQPGERVRVRSAEDILATLDKDRKHAGLSIEIEMLRHCGKTYRVASRVRRIIDERNGKMIKFANECIALEGVACSGLDNRRRIFCPRGPLYYWREGWLQRVEGPVL